MLRQSRLGIPAQIDYCQVMRRILISATVIAFALLIALDAWLGLAHPLTHVPTANLDRGEIFSALSAYRKLAGPGACFVGLVAGDGACHAGRGNLLK